ncbi:MAG: hypothetical protein HC895_23335 [Leptolyngbyaceae cyanobacterium SM1_3_5]|nr:hypothetical protein [Leptolyngbyaceae cyanobacterium SM1_3_5]
MKGQIQGIDAVVASISYTLGDTSKLLRLRLAVSTWSPLATISTTRSSATMATTRSTVGSEPTRCLAGAATTPTR